MNTAVVMLGSNFNKYTMLKRALEELQAQYEITDQSKALETTAVGSKSKSNYLNQAIKIHTIDSIDLTINHFKQIERKLGRTETVS